MKIIVGSLNPVKIQAVKLAYHRLLPDSDCFVEGEKCDSGVSHQPIGFDEILTGAHNRALELLRRNRPKDKTKKTQKIDFFVGIEAGFAEIMPDIFLDYQFCVIYNHSKKKSIGCGAGLSFPKEIINQLLKNRKIELGDIMAKISGNPGIKVNEGAIGYFSHGIIDRVEITKQSVEMALIPFINEELYFPNLI